jgi:hypothetical protein
MSRIPRICLVLGLSFVLLAATVPAAHARTLTKPQSTNSILGNWLNATLAWMANLATGAPNGQAPHGSKWIYTSGSGTDTSTYTMKPMTGSCIDPGGNPRPCPGI